MRIHPLVTALLFAIAPAAPCAEQQNPPAGYLDLDGDGRITWEELQGALPLPYAVVDTGQEACYDAADQISCPEQLEPWFGQDAQYTGNAPRYYANGDGTVTDLNTGLTWIQSADLNGDGDIDAADKLLGSELQAHVARINAQAFAGYADWRLPSIKELYSLIDFRGTDPSAESTDSSGLTPFIDTDYFAFGYGDAAAGERAIDSQWATSTLYVADANLMFGVNFADGRIKGYGMTSPDPQRGDKAFYVRLVRGNAEYGGNAFSANGDGTVNDQATGLTWMRQDSGDGMLWQDALDYCASATLGGQDDWRLPNAKELQSIVDYDRSPDTTDSAAIDPLFASTPILNEGGDLDFPYYWSSTTHANANGHGDTAVYVAFGRALGEMNGSIIDVHGAGCQRSDPKYGTAAEYPQSFGPQGDIRRVFNFVRCVRGGVATDIVTGGEVPPAPDTDPQQPPQTGCGGLAVGDMCSFEAPTGPAVGICRTSPSGLRCVPEGAPPPRPGQR